MVNNKTVIVVILITILTVSACAQQDGKIINSADELKKYLDSQPANIPDKPIKVAMKLSEPMFGKVKEAIIAAGKYVSLDLSGSPIKAIPEGAFFDRKGGKLLVGIILPNGITEIGDIAFTFTGLTSIKIPNSVTSIGDAAFAATDLTSVTIPASVTSIADEAFRNCQRLTSVTFQGTVSSEDEPFPFDLWEKYLAGGIGTYTTTTPEDPNSTWTKK